MRYAIFSDMHSNLEAYQAFLNDAKREMVEGYFCVGDIVGYGADPHRCIEITKGLMCPVVCGNHDWGVVGRADISCFNRYAKEAIIWTRNILDDTDKDYLNKLTTLYHNDKLTLSHGALEVPENFDYVLDPADAIATMRLQATQLCFIGHSHQAGIFFDDGHGHARYTGVYTLNMEEGRHYLVNVGSVGQPRDGDWRASYCIYDDKRNAIQIKRITYDVKRASEKILKAGLPKYLAERILAGR